MRKARVVGCVNISNSYSISHSMPGLWVCSVSCYAIVSDAAWLAPHPFFVLQLLTPCFGIRVSAVETVCDVGLPLLLGLAAPTGHANEVGHLVPAIFCLPI